MLVFTDKHNHDIVELLRAGSIGVLRTDTLYGLVCSAHNEAAVQRVYACKGRDDDKSPIVLIAAIEQMFDEPTAKERVVIDRVWPGPVSVIVARTQSPPWIRRHNTSVAYRVPAEESLRQLLQKTGPLIAPSANPQSKVPASTIQQAQEYFGSRVDFYVDEGEVTQVCPSQLLRITPDGVVEQLR